MVNMILAAAALHADVLGASQTLVFRDPTLFPARGESKVVSFDRVRPRNPFREAIVSWNVDDAAGAAVDVEIRANRPGHVTKWYRLGTWTYDLIRGPRETVNGQRDEDGTVDTDTLSLTQPAESVDLRLTLRTLADGPTPTLKLVAVNFSPKSAQANDAKAPTDAWGKVIDVPKRCQGDYPNGNVLCSATSSSMLLKYWSQRLDRPDIDADVPEVTAGVWDKVYRGAGNWPFNTAFLGATSGMVSYVSRFNQISDLEAWIGAGYPLACSVSYSLVKGDELSPTEQGHLMVLVGFTATGDPIFNDPARRSETTTTYRRADFERAWMYSNRTVYLFHPIGAKLPKGFP